MKHYTRTLSLFLFISFAFAQTQLGSDIDGEAADDYSGYSVSMNSAGDRVAIGAYGNDGTASNAGHVRIFEYSNSSWTQIGSDIDGEAAVDYSGTSVSMNSAGDRVAIGADYNDGTGEDAGHVRVYEYSNSSWTQLGSDIDGEAEGDYSGKSVSMNSAGDRVAIGAVGHDSPDTSIPYAPNMGHVRVYEYSNSSWTQLGSDIDGEAAHDQSGVVSMNSAGDRVAIGAWGNDGTDGMAGHVRVYEYSNSSWTQIGSDIDGEAMFDYSGVVSMNSAGDRVAIGAIENDGTGSNAGHARVYEYSNSSWTQIGSDIDGEAANDYSGRSVSMNSAGDRVAIGANGNDGTGDGAGHVRVYEYSNSSWTQIESDIDGEAAGDYSGYSVSMNSAGDRVAIGAPLNDGTDTNAGHVRIFDIPANNGLIWHVATTGSDATGDGSEENPFATIQTAIDSSSDGETVLVAAGTYVGSLRYSGGFSSIEVMYPDIVTHLFIISESGPDSTIIIPDTNDVYGYYERAISVTYEGNLHLDGFTITESTQPIFCGSFADGLVINNCIIKNSYQANNSQQNNGQIIQISEFDDTVFVFNTLVYNCTSNEPLFDGGYNVIMENVTIVDNHGSLGMGGGGVYGYNIKNSIIRNNIDDEGQINNVGENVLITYTDWEGGYEGEGNIDANPLFCNPDSGDYTLAANSPCLGTGENGANMGAFGLGCVTPISFDWDFSLSEPVIEVMGADDEWNPGDTISISMDFCNNTDVGHFAYPGAVLEADSNLTSLPFTGSHHWFYGISADTCYSVAWHVAADTSIVSDTIATFSAYPKTLNCDDENQGGYCIDGDTVTFEIPIVVQVVSTESEHFVPEEFTLHQNYPNPFNPVTTIQYDIPEAGHVRLDIYNILGEKVSTLASGNHEVGRYAVNWDASGMSSGMYFYRISSAKFTATKKLVLMK